MTCESRSKTSVVINADLEKLYVSQIWGKVNGVISQVKSVVKPF